MPGNLFVSGTCPIALQERFFLQESFHPTKYKIPIFKEIGLSVENFQSGFNSFIFDKSSLHMAGSNKDLHYH